MYLGNRQSVATARNLMAIVTVGGIPILRRIPSFAARCSQGLAWLAAQAACRLNLEGQQTRPRLPVPPGIHRASFVSSGLMRETQRHSSPIFEAH